MSKLQELIARLCPNGVEFKPLGEVCENICSGGTPLTSNKSYYNGSIPWLRTQEVDWRDVYDTEIKISEEAVNNSSAKLIPANCVIVAMYGATAAKVCINKIPLTTNQACCNLEINASQAYYKYVYYWLCNSYEKLKAMGEGSQHNINSQKIKNFLIPIPPLEVQEEIVRILDRFSEYAAELQAELQARKEQYEYYRNLLLTFNPSASGYGTDDEQKDSVTNWGGSSYKIQWMKMGEIGTVKMCKRIMKHQTSSSGDVPFYKIGTFGKEADAYISRELYEDYKHRFSFPSKGTILISAAGTIGRCVIYDGEDAYFQDSNIVWLDNDEKLVLNSYLYHFYQIVDWDTDGGTIKRLYNDKFLATPIPVPPMEVQEKIVGVLDRFETLVNDLSKGLPAEIEAVRERYEYYRNKLLTFKEIPA